MCHGILTIIMAMEKQKNNSVKEQTDSTSIAVGKEIGTSYMPVLMFICENAAWFLMMLLVVIVMLISMTVYYTRPPTVTVDIPSSNTFDEETCSVSHNVCNICTLHVPYTMFCH